MGLGSHPLKLAGRCPAGRVRAPAPTWIGVVLNYFTNFNEAEFMQ